MKNLDWFFITEIESTCNLLLLEAILKLHVDCREIQRLPPPLNFLSNGWNQFFLTYVCQKQASFFQFLIWWELLGGIKSLARLPRHCAKWNIAEVTHELKKFKSCLQISYHLQSIVNSHKRLWGLGIQTNNEVLWGQKKPIMWGAWLLLPPHDHTYTHDR